jgi:hypothetical protein
MKARLPAATAAGSAASVGGDAAAGWNNQPPLGSPHQQDRPAPGAQRAQGASGRKRQLGSHLQEEGPQTAEDKLETMHATTHTHTQTHIYTYTHSFFSSCVSAAAVCEECKPASMTH